MSSKTKNHQMYVKPGEGRMPRNIDSGRRIAAEGEWINDHAAHRRLLSCDDVVPATPPKKNTAAKTPPKH